MKKRIYFSISLIFLLIILTNLVLADCTTMSPCCCQTYPGSGQKRCYTSGICCDMGSSDEFWDLTSCYAFSLSVSGPRVLKTGYPTPINVYLENTGAYSDSYELSYSLNSINPNLIIIIINETDPEETKIVVPDVSDWETRTINPRVKVLSTTATGEITFTGKSMASSKEKSAKFIIIESDLPFSLPDFNSILILVIIAFSTLIYYYKKKIY